MPEKRGNDFITGDGHFNKEIKPHDNMCSDVFQTD